MRLRTPAVLAVCSALALGVAACGSDNESSAKTSNQSASKKAEPVAQIDALTGKSTAVALDPGFVEALGSLKLTPAPVGDGTVSKKGVASFPITGGNVTYYKPGSVSPYVQGSIMHDGSGLSLTSAGKNGKKVELTNFVVDPGASVLTGTVTVDGEEAAPSAPLFFLDGGTLQPLKVNDDGTAVLKGTTVELKAEAAELLNTTFGTDALMEGLKIGVATITVNTQ